MSYYVCIGKTNYYATLNKPVYTEFHDPTFIDYMDWMVGYAKTVQELNIIYPFPNNYIDLDKRIWVLRDGTVPDNHQFLRTKEIVWQNQTVYKSRTREKYQDPKPHWDSQSAQTPSLWSQLKLKGRIK